ncbi:MAG: TonB-dependent receptor [Vicinamibacterales bacterium]
MYARLIRFLAVLLTVLGCATVAHAQTTIVVVDASGAPVPGAAVQVGTASGETGNDGTRAFADAAPGARVDVTAPGFAPATGTVAPGQTRMRLVLYPAPLVDAVVVTSSRGTERLATPAGTTVVTSAELTNFAAGSIDDALRNTPGFSLFRRSSSRVSNPTTQGVTLRGLSGSGASRTMVLADGQPLNDPFGSWVYWNRIPQAAVERVEVVRGATGDLYGAQALGGVVQLLTFAPGRTRVRGTLDGGSFGTARASGFASGSRGPWQAQGAGELVRTDGVITVDEASRGAVDTPARSNYGTGFFAGGYDAGSWHGTLRVSLYDEERDNGTPLQVNTTTWKQLSGESGGTAAGGAWLVRAGGGRQEYFQTFSAIADDRQTERLTREQTTPSTFSNASGQWTRAWGDAVVLVGADGRRTRAEIEEFGRTPAGARTGPFFGGGVEFNSAVFGRVSLSPADTLTIVLGGRGDFWRSNPLDATADDHAANFFSPRASAELRLSDDISAHAAVYRAYRTPTLNELHRGFRVGNILTNANNQLDPERLTGFEGGLLVARGVTSARMTAFWNQLDDAITNVTISTTPALITRQRQNTDTVRATGMELELDVRPASRVTFGALVGVTRSTFTNTPAQPDLEGNRVPQVPTFQLGGQFTYVDPVGFTGSVQARVFGSQFDDDRNAFELEGFGVVDASLSQDLGRGLQVTVAVENLLDADYDVGRTPVRTIGWPRTFRIGVRAFLP